ncbi:MAG: hypothetical protein BGO67_11930 [Alphaproteobacteria bacterium 41-28]|nr:MAG: hypothetical protein BGO67_11930 [Alphaproteobacteria bacterium 41-28]
MKSEQAETIALQALSFLVRDDKLLSHFLMTTGLTPQELKKRIREPDLLGGVLDAILSNDTILLDFCNATSLSPETIVMARRALPGGFTIE